MESFSIVVTVSWHIMLTWIVPKAIEEKKLIASFKLVGWLCFFHRFSFACNRSVFLLWVNNCKELFLFGKFKEIPKSSIWQNLIIYWMTSHFFKSMLVLIFTSSSGTQFYWSLIGTQFLMEHAESWKIFLYTLALTLTKYHAQRRTGTFFPKLFQPEFTFCTEIAFISRFYFFFLI